MVDYFKRSIRRQVLFLMMAVSLIALVGITGIFVFQNNAKVDYLEQRSELSEKNDLIHDMERTISNVVVHMRGYAAFGNEYELAESERLNQNLTEQLSTYGDLNLSEQERQIIGTIQAFQYNYWKVLLPSMQPLIEGNNYQELKDKSRETDSTSQVNNILNEMGQIRSNIKTELENSHNSFLNTIDYSSYYLIVFLILIFISLSLAARSLTKTISEPITELSNASEALARGEEVKINRLDRLDQLGVLSHNFADMANKIKDREDNLSSQNERLKEQRSQMEIYLNDLKNLNFALNESSIVAVIDGDGNYKKVNQNFCDISQYREEELVNQHFLSIISHHKQSEYSSDIRSKIYNKRVWSGELELIKKDGSAYWVYATIVPYFDENENVQQYVSIQKDITPIKETENRLRKSLDVTENTKRTLERYNQMNHALSIAQNQQELLDTVLRDLAFIYRFDKGVIFSLKSNNYSTLGIESNKFTDGVQVHYVSVINRLRNDPSAYVVERKASDDERGYHDQLVSHDLHVPILSSKGELMAILVCTRIGNQFSDKDIEEVEGILKRVTLSIEKINYFDQTENNRQLNQDIIDNINEGIQFVDLTGNIIQYNEKWKQLFGIEYDSHSFNKDYLVWLNQSFKNVKKTEAFNNYLVKAIFTDEKNRTSYQFEMENSETSMIVAYSEAIYRQEQRIGTLFVYRDITAEYEVDQMKSNLVSTVSHELRTPLASVLGYTELMINKQLKPERQERYLKTIHKEAKRLTNLINDFLDLQRMESGRQEYHKEQVNIAEIAQEVVEGFQVNNQIHTLKVSNQSSNPFVQADPQSMIQLFNNLISNAIKFSPNGGDVIVSLNNNEDQLYIHISDEGIGIPDYELKRLFTKFHRVDNSSKQNIGGTGLGLAICKEIAEAHNGRVSVRSALNKGSVFTIILPLHPLSITSRKDKKDDFLPEIVLVEDDLSLSRLLEDELKDAGFFVRKYSEGNTIVNQLHELKPDAFVVDLMLGKGKTGWEVIKNIKNQSHLVNTPIFISSALEEKEKAQELGVDDYLTKPYPPNKLSTVILQTLLQHEKQGQILYANTEDDNTPS
ncbi:PAS domain S-box protein [Aquibacillus halophilus]|uniref:histidine kinase n=1 Tax=Aquibacillus halophilus TaxID=930132 RepID=A0A6A8DCI0_9BACI|nr:ATP-binding protein [Aquibacillus halophilus]MRH43358.1 PAS domain S-box protein [Aquibacillus halophilus]